MFKTKSWTFYKVFIFKHYYTTIFVTFTKYWIALVLKNRNSVKLEIFSEISTIFQNFLKNSNSVKLEIFNEISTIFQNFCDWYSFEKQEMILDIIKIAIFRTTLVKVYFSFY